jgi:hypothetical protein
LYHEEEFVIIKICVDADHIGEGRWDLWINIAIAYEVELEGLQMCGLVDFVSRVTSGDGQVSPGSRIL